MAKQREYEIEVENAVRRRIAEVYPSAMVRSRFSLSHMMFAIRVRLSDRSALYFVTEMVLRDSYSWAISEVSRHILYALKRPKTGRKLRVN